jgi:FAD:protein FMN transferase
MGKTFLNYTLFFILLFFTQCKVSHTDPQRYNRFVLGTVCQITLYEEGKDGVVEEAFGELSRIESVFSRNIDTSDIATFNRESEESVGTFSYVFLPETAGVLSRALEYANTTGGLYNPAVGPLVDLWGIGSESARIPSQDEIDRILPILDSKDLILENGFIRAKAGMSLDLGGIAKGYAADRVKAVLEKAGIERGIVNLGGNVLVMGSKEDGSLWNVGIQNPLSERGDYIGIISMESTSMVTSGNYERYFEEDGIRYHHILDSSSGYPIANNLAACTVVTPQSIDADALSTSLYSMGLEEGMAFTEASDYFEALFVTKDNKVYLSSGLGKSFKLTNEDFILSSL